MSAATDKARFYIEQTVPDLRAWERRQLFTKSEISSITSQRTAYETQLNSREATPSLYIRYLTYDSNISLLLSKRIVRHAVPPRPAQKLRISQQKRLFQILDRATTRFKGDLNLWAQYLHYCREQAAIKRGQRVLTECLRLFPTRPEVWGYAAGWAEGSGDLSAARGYYLRGLRFCGEGVSDGKDLYLRFARAEMRWIRERRKALGIQAVSDLDHKAIDSATILSDGAQQQEAADAKLIKTSNPPDTANDEGTDEPNSSEAGPFNRFSSTPAMSGAIPMAIFDQAMKAYHHAPSLSEAFFDMFAQFADLPCARRILQHVIDSASDARSSEDAVLQNCRCRMPLIWTRVDAQDFPAALRLSLTEINTALSATTDDRAKSSLAAKLLEWIAPLASDDKLVPELKIVLEATTRRLSLSQPLAIAPE